MYDLLQMNKLSTLEDAINYIKKLQGQVLSLELRVKSAVEHGSSENPQGSLSIVSSPNDFKLDDIPASAPPQTHCPDAEPEATAAAAAEPEQAPVEVVVKEAQGGQVVVQLQAGQRKGLVSDVMTAMDGLSLDVHQVSIITSGASIYVTLLTSSVSDACRIPAVHFGVLIQLLPSAHIMSAFQLVSDQYFIACSRLSHCFYFRRVRGSEKEESVSSKRRSRIRFRKFGLGP